MFLDKSRYAAVPTTEVTLGDGRTITVVTIRYLPDVRGKAHVVKGNDRLDLMAFRGYGDATKFWHVADANTELDSRVLTAEAGSTIQEPES